MRYLSALAMVLCLGLSAALLGCTDGGGSDNDPPPADELTVSAGADQTIDEGEPVALAGTIENVPAGATPTFAWTKHSGPGSVTFAAAAAEDTAATFSRPGEYELQLAVIAGSDQATDRVKVTVTATPVNVDLALTAPSNGAEVSGLVTITATLSSLGGVTAVRFLVDGTVIDEVDAAATMSTDWNSLQAANGAVELGVEAVGVAASDAVSVTVANPRTLHVADATGEAGGTATVRLLLNDTSGVAGFSATLTWDPARLRLDSVAKGADTGSALFTSNDSTPGELVAAAAGVEAFTATGGGEMLTATFTILAPSPAGTDNAVTVTTGGLSDTLGDALTVAVGSGLITTL